MLVSWISRKGFCSKSLQKSTIIKIVATVFKTCLCLYGDSIYFNSNADQITLISVPLSWLQLMSLDFLMYNDSLKRLCWVRLSVSMMVAESGEKVWVGPLVIEGDCLGCEYMVLTFFPFPNICQVFSYSNR